MRVKRYVVDTMPDALKRIRSDLGGDAVILNTKQVRSGGIFGLFGKKRIEVIAATDSALPATGPASASRPPRPAERTVSASENPRQIQTDPAIPIRTTTSAAVKTAYHHALSGNVQPTTASGQKEHREEAHENSVSSPPSQESAAAQAPAESAEPKAKPDSAGEHDLMGELKQMKSMIEKLSLRQLDADPSVPEPFRAAVQRLKQQEISSDLIVDIVSRIISDSDAAISEIGAEEANQLVRGQLHELIRSRGIEPLKSETRIAHFVGPTGVGKTTTIAKLAAEQVLKYNRKVGFITSDTYRIAAVEQLKTYATILNVPLEVVFSVQETGKALEKLADRDVIFMDTAGRNYRNEVYVEELNKLLLPKHDCETYLVLSLTSKYKDMKVITDNFFRFDLDKVLFTKRDETDTYGAVFNLINDFQLKLSYITHGQNVPDDIEQVKDKTIIDLLMEEPRNE